MARIEGADTWQQDRRWEARGSMPGSYGLPTITDDQGGHIAYVKSVEHAPILAAALDLQDACRAALAYIGEESEGVVQDQLRAALGVHVEEKTPVRQRTSLPVMLAAIDLADGHSMGAADRLMQALGSELGECSNLAEHNRFASEHRPTQWRIGRTGAVSCRNCGEHCRTVQDESVVDTASSASRQHYIETGRYLLVGEALKPTT